MLRKAVIACMAAVTGISTTVATGTLLVSMLSQQAQAGYSEGVFTGTDNKGIDLETLVVPDGQTLTFAMSDNAPTGVGQGNYFANSAQTYTGDIYLRNDLSAGTGLCISNASGNTVTFAGSVYGYGNISKIGNGTGFKLVFSGDASGLGTENGIYLEGTAKIKLSAGADFTLIFKDTNNSTSTKGVSGMGDISFSTDKNLLVYEYAASDKTVYITNKISSTAKSKVELTGGANYEFTKSVTIDELTVKGGKVVFSSGWSTINKADIKGATTIGGKVNFANWDLTNIHNITANDALTVEGQVTLGGALTLSQAITNKGTVYIHIDDTLSIDLAGITAETTGTGKGATGTYTLIEGGTVLGSYLGEPDAYDNRPYLSMDLSTLTSDQIAAVLTGVDTVGKEWSFADGKIMYTVLATDLVWSQADPLTWHVGTEFDGGAAFANDDNVTFAENLGDVTATIDGDIGVSQLTVKAGTDLALAGTGAMEINKAVFEAGSGLTIGADREMTWAPVAGTEGTPKTLTVLGKLTVVDGAFNSSDITVDAGQLMFDHPTSHAELKGNITVMNGGILTLKDSDTLVPGVAQTITVDGGELVSDGRTEFAANDKIILKNGTISGTGDGHGALDFSAATVTVVSGGDSTISAPIRLRNNGVTTTFTVEDGTLTVSEICHKGNGSAGSFAKDGAGTLVVTGNLAHQGTTTVSEGILQFGGTTQANSAVVLGGGSLGVTAAGSASLSELRGEGSITVTEGGVLTLNKVDAGAAGITVTGAATAGAGFAKTGEGILTLDVLNVASAFNMNGWSKLTLNSVNLTDGAELVYGAGDVLSIGSVSSDVTINVFGVADQLSAGFDTGITLADGQGLQDLKELMTVNGVDSYDLVVGDNGRVWLSSTATIQSDWDTNWGAELAKAPSKVTQGSVGTLTAGADGAMKLYELYGNATYTPVTGTVAISLTGDGDVNGVILGGNDAQNDKNLGTVTTNAWIEANEGTYKAIVGGNYANNWDTGARADFVGSAHIKVDGATVGVIVGGNYKEARGAVFTGNSYISVFSGDVTGAIIGASLLTHGNQTTFTGDTNIFIYTPLNTSTARLNGEPADMVIGGFAWGHGNTHSGATLDGNTNITVDLSGYTGDATSFGKHIIGGGFNSADGKQAVTNDTNIVMDLGSVEMANGMKVIGGNWCDKGSTDIGSTNITIKGGTYKAPVVGGSWITSNAGTHTIGATNITISGGTLTGSNLFGGSRVATANPTITTGDISILINGDAVVNHVYGGHSIESDGDGPNTNLITTNTDSIEITVDEDAQVMGAIIGGNFVYRNNNSQSTVATGDITINLKDGTLNGNVYAAGEVAGTQKQKVNSTTVNLSSVVELPSKVISGGYDGDTTVGEISTTAKLAFTDAVTYSNISGTQFKDFNAIELADGANVTMVDFTALNKELAVSGAGVLNMGSTAAVALDKLTLSGATVTVDNGISSTTGLTLNITKPSKLILPTKVGEQSLTLSALDMDMTGAVANSPYVEIAGALNGTSDVLVNLTGVSSLAAGEYKLISAESTGISADDLQVTYDTEAPEGMEYVVELIGSNLVFRKAFLSDWVWEGNTNGESNVWANDENGWKSEEGSPNGENVYFTAAGEGEVTVSGVVNPANMNVTGGEYTFLAQDAAASIQLGESGVLSISDGATVNMAMANANLGGTTELSGELVLQSANAIGNSALKFNGGTLVYDTLVDEAGNKIHITTDLSTQSGLADGYTGRVKIEVTHAENTVTWGGIGTYKSAVPGIQAILEKGIDYNDEAGEGKMNLQFRIGSDQKYNGAINVGAGELYYTVAESVPTFAGAVNVESGAKLGFNTTLNADSARCTVSGAITGGGVVELGSDGVASGRYALTGNNSAFAGTIALLGDGTSGSYNYVAFQNGNAFGGADTTVRLDGRGIYFREAPTTHATVEVIGNKESNALEGINGTQYVFLGKWKGAEDAQFRANDYNITIALAGDLSEYKGTFTSSARNTWVLGGEGVAGTGSLDMKELNGTGTFKVQYNSETQLNTVVGGTANLQQSGSGKLILAAENTTTGTLTVDKGTEVQLGNAATAGAWAGSELAGEGTFILTYGELRGLTTKADGAKLAVKTTQSAVSTFARRSGAGGGTIVVLKESDVSLLDSIELAEGSTLIVDDDLIVGGEGNTKLDMALTTDNLGANRLEITAMIQGGDLTIAGTEGVNLTLNKADLLTALDDIGKGDLYLQITDGALATAEGLNINDVIAPDLLGLGVRAQLTKESSAGGYVVINGDITDVYFTDNQEGSSADRADTVPVTDGVLGIYAATVVNTNDTLKVSVNTNINNLNGQEGGNVVIADGAEVTLNNEVLPTGGNPDWTDPAGADNTLAGNLTGEAGSSITVKGEGGSLTVGGALTADTLIVESGDLYANGGADVETLTVAKDATMTVANGMELKDGSIQGVLKADGAGTSLSTTGEVSVGGMVSNMDLTIEDGSVVYLSGDPDSANEGAAYLNSLQVEERATLMGTGAKVDLGASQPSSIAGTLSGDGSLTTSADTQLTFDNATGAAGWDVTNKGEMLVDITESGNITLGALTLGAGSDTTLKINSDNGTSDLLTLQVLSVENGAGLTIESIGGGQLDSGEYVLGTVTDHDPDADPIELHASLNGTAFSRLDKVLSYISVNEDGEIVLNAVKSTVNELANAATDPNATAGAELLWNAAAPVGGELEDVYNAVNEMIAAGNAAGANEAMAAVAGSSTASLGMAFAGDVERQLRAIRNRTTTMGVNQCVVNEGMPYFNAWVNAEGNFGELDQDGLASGYQLDSWGGTVGFDVDVNPNLTLGLAVTAMYGDLTVDGPDMLEGDMDTYYVTAFARYSKRAWTHTFIGTIGMMDGSYERTVNYAGGSYKTEGDTDGMAFGLMYEVGRVYALTEDGNACLQPVFNIAYRHTTVGGYTEDGSDAALDVDDQTLDTITLGAGARFQAVVGENLYNRTSVLELRALAKLDVGDRASEADVALINGTGRGTVESAELGAFGVELGAGLSIPVGDDNDGTIFFDVSAELRSGYNNVNGTVGYRINF